jgi:hypothetical protein
MDNNIVLDKIEQETKMLLGNGGKLPDWFNNPATTDQQKIEFLEATKTSLGKMNVLQNDINTLKLETEQQVQQAQKAQETTNQNKKASKAFNYYKYSQDMNAIPANDIEKPALNNVANVRAYLDGFITNETNSGHDLQKATSNAMQNAFNDICKNYINSNEIVTNNGVQGDAEQTVRDSINSYYSSDSEIEKDNIALLLVKTIFPNNDMSTENGEIPVQKETNIEVLSKVIEDTNNYLQKLAKMQVEYKGFLIYPMNSPFKSNEFNFKYSSDKYGHGYASSVEEAQKKIEELLSQKTAVTFNYSKFAQHKTLRNVSEIGLGEPVRSQETGMLITKWHLEQRNKGYGLQLKDYWSADWEKVWRENVMDKYDPTYIERRFDVERNVAPLNDLQLKPGQKRKPFLPELQIQEAQIEFARNDREGIDSPFTKGEVFNWKTASKKKIVNPLSTPPLSKHEWKCFACGASLPVSSADVPAHQCAACKAIQGNKAIKGDIKYAPNAKKASIESFGNGIFFDGNKFIVVAQNNKNTFNSYEEAENCDKSNKSNVEVTSEYGPDELHKHADELAIDG